MVTLHPDDAGVPNLAVELASSAPGPSSALQPFSNGYSTTTFVLDGVNVPAGTYWVVVARTAALDGLPYYIVQLRLVS